MYTECPKSPVSLLISPWKINKFKRGFFIEILIEWPKI